ncbi:Mrp/NBP35 family ATP-binding protein [Sporohalobacter salinus]|uniref:Mrp/NBP35 family ATP-binding protein n=1 Tax=Sporohalobacter salinus TaxID=1494606 RepID=UPI00196055F1|nr:Mrp/NBP35 family ATP-binding protein [Sporohalobacter salinus]MBM7622700.1 ATP-binding protein involved in chromosome partitioning [Sporohalobacter salinus]
MYELENGKFDLEYGSVNEGLISVASGKGGVGKSTVTVNLAVALNKLGKQVGIIDADIRGFSIPRILGLTEELQALEDKMLKPPVAKGIKVMSMGSLVEEEAPIIWRAPLLHGTLEQFMKEVQWGKLDYLLFDLPPGTGDMPLNIMQNLPESEVMIVTTPQITATNVAGRIGKMADKLECETLGVVENMSYYQCTDCGNKDYIFGQGGGKDIAEKLETKLLGKLPLLPDIREDSDQGKSIILENPEADVSKEFISIAEKVINKKRNFKSI